jgi:hypothetical protein
MFLGALRSFPVFVVLVRILVPANRLAFCKEGIGLVYGSNYLSGVVHDWVLALGAGTENPIGNSILISTTVESGE